MKIPKIFHHVWLGKQDPEKFEKYRLSWMLNHPTWSFYFWTDDNLPEIINQNEFNLAKNEAQRCDILKYELVYRFGGIYVDMDFWSLKNIEPLIQDLDAFSASEGGKLISVGIFGGIPNHLLYDKMIKMLPESFKDERKGRQDLSTGPGLMTRAAVGLDLKVFDSELFYPYHFTEMHRKYEYFPNAYAVHHWEHSWRDDNIRLFC
jgi:mannosyltransferase OCH1-like enzyme